jgi:hypothetical protein
MSAGVSEPMARRREIPTAVVVTGNAVVRRRG